MLNYPDKNYAIGRLEGTIVRHKGRPVMVQQIIGDGVLFKDLITGKAGEGNYSDLDINPVPLGYTNFKGSAYYISRCPMRKDWKQGLRAQTMRALPCGSSQPISSEIALKEVARTIIGDFPSLQAVIKNLVDSESVFSMAFSRAFAIDKEMDIWHKSIRNIGKLNPSNLKTQVKKEFSWIEEELKECIA